MFLSVKVRTRRAHASLLVITLAISLLSLFVTNIESVKAATTIASNTDDNYLGGSWTGLRPQKPNEIMTFNQTVSNRAVSTDSVAEAMLTTKVHSLITGPQDQVTVSFILNANSRHGITYTFAGPEPLPFPYVISSAATNLGNSCGGGRWITIPEMVFYGAAGLSGYYTSVWVSTNGYISLFGGSTVGSLGPGVIAPFSTQFNNNSCAGTAWFWLDGSGGFFVAWDGFQSCNAPGFAPQCYSESFLVWVHNAADHSSSPLGESGIEFWYNSVTFAAGVQTAIGIADQQGGRAVSISSSLVRNNQRLVLTGLTGPKYLNSLKVSLTDTSNSVQDSNAQVVLDPSTNPPGIPQGYNILVVPTGPPTIDLPDYARVAFGAGAFVVAQAATTSGIEWVDPVLGLAMLGLDTYNLLVQDYRNAQQLTYYSQTKPGDSSPAFLHAWAAQGGVSLPNSTPTDASMAGKIIWILTDGLRNVPHTLTLTATVGFTDATAQRGVDTFTTTVSDTLNINPDYEVFFDQFGSGNFNPNNWAATGTWQVTTSCPLFNGVPNCIAGNLAYSGSKSNEFASLILTLGNLVNYNQLVVYLHIWASLGPNEQVGISYLNSGTWQSFATYAGSLSGPGPSTSPARAKTAYTQWINARMGLPATTTAIGFFYTTGPDAPDPGFYLGDIHVFGDGPGGSADIQTDGQVTCGGQQHSVPISMDSGPFYYTTDHFLEATGTHTLTAQTFFTDNTGSYSFSQWCDGVTSSSRTIIVGQPSSFLAGYSIVPDFAVTANPASLNIGPGATVPTTIYVTSRNGFTGPVTLTANTPSGITASPSPNTLSLTANTMTYTLTVNVGSSVADGTYTVAVTGTGSGLSSLVSISVLVSSGGGGGGGSVAAGTKITMFDGSTAPVQNLRAGMQLLSYDTGTNKFVSTTITRLVTVVTNNSMVIQTTAGSQLRVDQNPVQKLYVMLPNGTQTMLSVTLLKVGYSLFDVPKMSWVQITSITYQMGGNHTMYDIYNTFPGNYVANGYLDPHKM